MSRSDSKPDPLRDPNAPAPTGLSKDWPDLSGRIEDDGVHRLAVRVYYEDTDFSGVVYHASYLRFMERARTEWLRSRGRSYRDIEDDGFLLQVIEFVCRYHKPVDYDDVVAIRVRIESAGRAAVVLGYEARRERDGEVCATGSTRLACVGRDGKLKRLPPELAGGSA